MRWGEPGHRTGGLPSITGWICLAAPPSGAGSITHRPWLHGPPAAATRTGEVTRCACPADLGAAATRAGCRAMAVGSALLAATSLGTSEVARARRGALGIRRIARCGSAHAWQSPGKPSHSRHCCDRSWLRRRCARLGRRRRGRRSWCSGCGLGRPRSARRCGRVRRPRLNVASSNRAQSNDDKDHSVHGWSPRSDLGSKSGAE